MTRPQEKPPPGGFYAAVHGQAGATRRTFDETGTLRQ